VFVRIDPRRAFVHVKLAAAAPGLTGIVVPDAEAGDEIEELDALLREREREEGLLAGSVEIFPLLGTARGIWNVREIVRANSRVAAMAIDEGRLCASMGIVQTHGFDPLAFSRGRVIVETLAAVKLPLGWLPDGLADAEVDSRLDRARNSGFKGAVCPRPGWVGACNDAFTPSDEQVAYYREVRKVFADGVARGTAAVPFPGGRMIDVPVDERARLVIDWWERCQRRDAEKRTAHAAGS
jgi:citrate lyase subunit beta/citryl-CoA lyase